jgi:hypothetical protein
MEFFACGRSGRRGRRGRTCVRTRKMLISYNSCHVRESVGEQEWKEWKEW